MEERYQLAKTRILELSAEVKGEYKEFLISIANLFQTIFEVNETDNPTLQQYKKWNESLYADLSGDAYRSSFANPAYSVACFGEKTGPYISWYAASVRDAVTAAYEKDEEEIVLCMELFLQAVTVLEEEEEPERFLKEIMYYYIHDYAERQMEKKIRSMLCFSTEGIYDIVMNSDFSDSCYLYRYGEYITDNEMTMAEYLQAMPEETLAIMART